MANKRRRKPETGPTPSSTIDGVPYKVHDAFHTLRRAREIIGNKKLMGQVAKHAKTIADEHKRVGDYARHLAGAGKISTEQLAKLEKNRTVG